MIYIDLETIPDTEAIKSDTWARVKEKAAKRGKEITDQDASFDPCFGRILCICAAVQMSHGWEFFAELTLDEEMMISKFDMWWAKVMNDLATGNTLCAHNGIGFDFPFLAKRYLANRIRIPNPLRFEGKKPWEIPHVDTMNLLKFGSFQNHTSLDAACFLLGVKTPKGGIDGSKVWEAHLQGRDDEILKYCKADVNALAGVHQKLVKLGAA